MTEDEVRAKLRSACAPYSDGRPKSFGLSGWCRANGVATSAASRFLAGKDNAPSDVLRALGLRRTIVPILEDETDVRE